MQKNEHLNLSERNTYNQSLAIIVFLIIITVLILGSFGISRFGKKKIEFYKLRNKIEQYNYELNHVNIEATDYKNPNQIENFKNKIENLDEYKYVKTLNVALENGHNSTSNYFLLKGDVFLLGKPMNANGMSTNFLILKVRMSKDLSDKLSQFFSINKNNLDKSKIGDYNNFYAKKYYIDLEKIGLKDFTSILDKNGAVIQQPYENKIFDDDIVAERDLDNIKL